MSEKEYKCPNCGKPTKLSDNETYYINIEDELFCSEKCLYELGESNFQKFKQSHVE